MRTRPPSAAGYSLTEMLMVVAIVGILSSVGPVLLVQLQNFNLMTTARNDIQRDARAAISVINRMLRQGKSSTIIIDRSASDQGPYSRIRFTHVDGRAVEFRQSGNKLVQKVAGKESTLTKNLSYIAFSFPRSDDPTLVSVSITMSKSIQLGKKKALELTIQKIRVMN